MSIDQMLQQSIGAHNAGNLQEAERLYRTILQVQPKHPDANHNLGLIALSKNQPDAALALFKTATEANSNIEQYWLTYIEVLITQGQFEDAKRALKKGKKKGVAKAKLKTLTQKLVSVKAGNIPAQVPSQAEIQNLTNHYKNGQYDAAEKLAMLLTQQFPENQFSWKVLGAVLGQTGRKSEAVNANQKAVALSPQDAEAHSNLGITLQELGRLDEAEASYRKAIALKPDFTEAHSNLGITLKELGRLEEAEASYRQAITLESGYAGAHSNLGITLQELGRLEEAEASYAQAIALKSDYAEAYSNLGVTLQELGRLEEAEASCRQAIALKSDYAGALNNLGMTLQQLGRLKEAEASYTQAIALKPDYAEAYSNLGVTLNAMGLKESALQHFERNLQLERGINPVNLRHKSFRTISKAKIDHDIEQFEYLAASGYDIKKFRELATLYKTVSSEINCTLDTDILPLSDKHQSLLGDTYNRPIHILEAPALDESTIGDCLDVNKITEDYFEHEFGLTYFDDFLTPTTLYSLREFLLGSTIWFDFPMMADIWEPI